MNSRQTISRSTIFVHGNSFYFLVKQPGGSLQWHHSRAFNFSRKFFIFAVFHFSLSLQQDVLQIKFWFDFPVRLLITQSKTMNRFSKYRLYWVEAEGCCRVDAELLGVTSGFLFFVILLLLLLLLVPLCWKVGKAAGSLWHQGIHLFTRLWILPVPRRALPKISGIPRTRSLTDCAPMGMTCPPAHALLPLHPSFMSLGAFAPLNGPPARPPLWSGRGCWGRGRDTFYPAPTFLLPRLVLEGRGW